VVYRRLRPGFRGLTSRRFTSYWVGRFEYGDVLGRYSLIGHSGWLTYMWLQTPESHSGSDTPAVTRPHHGPGLRCRRLSTPRLRHELCPRRIPESASVPGVATRSATGMSSSSTRPATTHGTGRNVRAAAALSIQTHDPATHPSVRRGRN
jgi:hypothetical protein